MLHRRTLPTLVLALLIPVLPLSATLQNPPVTLVGAVLDSVSALPVAHAAVYVDGRSLADTTDDAGEFTIDGVEDGNHVVLLMRDGYDPSVVQFAIPESLDGEIDIGVIYLAPGPEPKATLTGTVTDSRTEQPVLGVNVSLNGRDEVVTNVLGRFRIEGASANWGDNVLSFRRIGYEPLSADLWVSQRETDLDLDIVFDASAIPMAEVVVEGDRTTYTTGLTPAFYQRQRVGLGEFFDMQDIQNIRPRVVTDILRRAIGWEVIPSSSGVNRIRSTRSIHPCRPLLFINGARTSQADNVDWLLSPDLIMGVEMYQGAQIPMEFNQTGSSCGVILLWMR